MIVKAIEATRPQGLPLKECFMGTYVNITNNMVVLNLGSQAYWLAGPLAYRDVGLASGLWRPATTVTVEF